MEKDNNILKVDIVAGVDSHISGNKMVKVCNGNIVEVECSYGLCFRKKTFLFNEFISNRINPKNIYYDIFKYHTISLIKSRNFVQFRIFQIYISDI